MNEWYSYAMVGLAISGATDWVWVQCRFLCYMNMNIDRECGKKDFLYSFLYLCS